jgi:hypothetical protein
MSGSLRAELRTPTGGSQRATIVVSGNATKGMQVKR